MSSKAAGKRRLAIIGASARAAAASAVRGGFEVIAFDRFADADLAAMCPVVKLDGFDGRLPAALRETRVDGWLYTGGMENRRELVAELAAVAPLLGCGAAVLDRVRSPQWLAATLPAAGHAYAEVSTQRPPVGAGEWLVKRFRSGGGVGIRRYRAGEPIDDGEHFLQRYVAGTPVSGMYLAGGGRCELVAAFEQLIGQRWTGAAGEFMYCGAVGPLPAGDSILDELRRVGAHVAEAAGMTGLFGIDAIASDDRVTVLEVNPRYTASIELWERASGESAVSLHHDACCGGSWQLAGGGGVMKGGLVHAKAILYATDPVEIGTRFIEHVALCNAAAWPAIADIPRAGQPIAQGEPICTLLASGSAGAAAVDELRRFARVVQSWLGT